MKKLILLGLLFIGVSACHKDSTPSPSSSPPPQQVVTPPTGTKFYLSFSLYTVDTVLPPPPSATMTSIWYYINRGTKKNLGLNCANGFANFPKDSLYLNHGDTVVIFAQCSPLGQITTGLLMEANPTSNPADTLSHWVGTNKDSLRFITIYK